ncbi:MAG: hypothetical protein GY719_29775 [bacterium]|nr:hypothetical protein [bacterium]
MKKLLIAVVVLAVLIAVAISYVGKNLDAIVEGAIEKIGTKALGVEVAVGAVELKLEEGRGSIRGVEVANPAGYSAGNALSFGELTLEIDKASGAVVLVRAAAPEILVETKGESNNIETLLAGLSSDAPPAESEVETEAGEPLSLRIDRVEIEAARAVVTGDDREEPLELTVSELVFTGLEGTGEQIARQVLDQCLAHVRDAVSAALRAAVEEKVEEKKEELKEGLRDTLQEKLEEKLEGED